MKDFGLENLEIRKLKIIENVSLADKNWFRTGGEADFFCEPKSEEEFRNVINWAREYKVKFFVLGSGANVLISDDGFRGLVIRPKFDNIEVRYSEDEKFLVCVGAGVAVDDLIDFCLKNSLAGLEEFSGIPGTIGGAIYMNIHFHKFFLGDFLFKADLLDAKDGSILTVDNSWFNFGYDFSRLHERKHLLLSATFKLGKVSNSLLSSAVKRCREIKDYRINNYPTERTCGSFFKNFSEEEKQVIKHEKKVNVVAYYFEEMGFKGKLSVGGACVSELHSNMIVNTGNATSQDIFLLAEKIQKMTCKRFGVIPKLECILVGF